MVRVPAADWPEGSLRPVYFVSGWYPRIVSASRGPGYAPAGGQAVMEPLGAIPQVAHTYAYWDTNYGARSEKRGGRGCGAPQRSPDAPLALRIAP